MENITSCRYIWHSECCFFKVLSVWYLTEIKGRRKKSAKLFQNKNIISDISEIREEYFVTGNAEQHCFCFTFTYHFNFESMIHINNDTMKYKISSISTVMNNTRISQTLKYHNSFFNFSSLSLKLFQENLSDCHFCQNIGRRQIHFYEAEHNILLKTTSNVICRQT